MPPASLERVMVEGAAGPIETDLNDPGHDRRGIALIAHPNPLQGGTKDNKVVTTLAKTFYNLRYVAARPNFRGVGASAGAHDGGRWRDATICVAVADVRCASATVATRSSLPGFRSAASCRRASRNASTANGMVLVGPAVNRFAAEEVPADTLVIHGEHDDVVPLQAVLDWARPQHLPIVVVPGGEHFFHGRLNLLAQIVMRYFRVS